VAAGPETGARQDGDESGRPAGTPSLSVTPHPRLPRDLSQLWFVPEATGSSSGQLADFKAALTLADKAQFEQALPLLSRPSADYGALREYAAFYVGMAELRLGRAKEARRAFRAIQDQQPIGYLAEAAPLAEAEAAEALDDYRAAAAIYERLSRTKTSAPDEILMRLGGAAKAAGDLRRAAEAFGRVYYEFPLGASAPLAGAEYEGLPNVQPIAPGNERYTLELARAERLFGARRYPEARRALERLRAKARDADRTLLALRLAQCDFHERRFRTALEGLRPHLDRGPRRAEALYFYAVTLRRLGRHGEYLTNIRRVVEEFGAEPWAQDALNDLAAHYIRTDEDEQADAVFRELYDRNPVGRYAARAAWEIGWRAYRSGRYADAVRHFERAAADFPRSDYRPAWVYWSGRARQQLDQGALALERFALVTTDYHNSYYGRLAIRRLGAQPVPARVIAQGASDIALPPPNEPVVRALLEVARYVEALNELRYAERVWGGSPAIQATVAWIQLQQGRAASGREQFNLVRGSITTMRRAYPQFMAAGGEELPREILTAIFPLAYWELIQQYARQHRLDQYLVAALVAQESTFVPDIRSSAGAVGLMQLMPSTARREARKLKLAYSRKLLTDPEANIRMGTAYLAAKIDEFGSLHLALAAYNAGETAVRRWMAERGGSGDPEEFVDDIPYQETRNYVKRILGTADDYRRLYGS
jgi:soluble lytic murein transglycosylase